MLKKFGMKGGAMKTATMQTGGQGKQAISGEKIETCQNCGNQFILIWLTQGNVYNDFGLRHCPFCGLLTEELTGNVAV